MVTNTLYKVYARSTDVNRVLQSAVVNMAGFYAASKSPVVRMLGFMPVPIHSMAKSSVFI
jgi:hypothetical protein